MDTAPHDASDVLNLGRRGKPTKGCSVTELRGEELEWPYPGLPAAVVAEFAGHKVAGLPFFTPETITTDHGAVYRNHHLVEVQRVLGANILPARVLRPTDKHAVERTFGAIRSLLFEHLLGYTGVDVAGRAVAGRLGAAGGLLNIAEGVVRRNILHYTLGSWLALVGAAALFFDTAGVYTTVAILGGGPTRSRQCWNASTSRQ